MSLHVGLDGRGGGWQEGDGGVGGGRAARAARDVTGLLDKGGLREACHEDWSSSGGGLLKISSSVAGLLMKNNEGRKRRARNARKGGQALATISSHGWCLLKNHASVL